MSNCCCKNRLSCTAGAVITAIAVGVITAFLKITGEITLSSAFLWVTLGVALVYLAVTVIAAAVSENGNTCCASLTALIVGAIGTVLLSLLLLAVTFAATSFTGAFFDGLLLFFFVLMLGCTGCYVRCLCGQ